MQRFILVSAAALVAAGFVARLAASDEAAVPYPSGFRYWQFVKAEVVMPGHELYSLVGGVHHIYANERATQGYRKGVFADGSVLVFDLFEALDKDHAINAGQRRAVFVMHKDATRYAATAGWGWEGFAAGDAAKRTVDAKIAQQCVACHAQQKAHDYIFSRLEAGFGGE